MSSTPSPWIVSVRLDGAELDLAGVLADVTIRHGRDSATAGPTPSSASLAIWPVDRSLTGPFRVGVRLELDAAGPAGRFPLFRGVVTDAEIDDPTLSIEAAGYLASASRVELNLSTWVAERWSARCERILGSAPFGYSIEPDPDFDPVLEVATNPGTQTILAGTYADSLAVAVGAAIVDSADGKIVLQALGSRRSRPHTMHELDPAKVAYAPKWAQPLDVVNWVTVQFGQDQSQAMLVRFDGASQGRYGRRATELETTRIRSTADAETRAVQALARGAYPCWTMPGLVYLEPLPGLTVGDRVRVTDLPASAPWSSWAPVVEGWTHRIAGSEWTLDLTLSDPTLSGLAIAWVELPPDVRWNTVPPLEWHEADELGEFYP
jgi:hypothetical protein